MDIYELEREIGRNLCGDRDAAARLWAALYTGGVGPARDGARYEAKVSPCGDCRQMSVTIVKPDGGRKPAGFLLYGYPDGSYSVVVKGIL